MTNSIGIMQKYSDFFSDFKDKSTGNNVLWALKQREAAFEQFSKDGIPKQDVEEWNTVNYKNLTNNFFSVLPSDTDKMIFDQLNPKEKNCSIRMIFLNGRMKKIEVDKSVKGVRVNSLRYFMKNSPELVEGKISDASLFSEHRLSKHIDSRPQSLVALNAAFYQDGVVVLIDDNIILPGYIEIFHIGHTKNIVMSPVRSVLFMGKNSSCEIVERILPSNNNSPLYLSNHVTDIQLSDFSSLTYLRMVNGNVSDIHINTIHASLKNNSYFYCPSLISTYGQSRVESRVNLKGKNSSTKVDGLIIGNKKSTSDTLTRVSHEEKSCLSKQTFRTILNDESQAAFQGKIRVQVGADESNADMSSKSLLLSEKAMANAKPELEILADDVKCSHGVTVGNFDPEQIFYLCSRGISNKDARNLLTSAFSKVVTQDIPLSLSQVAKEFIGITNA